MMTSHKKRRGFTLLELTMVLMAVGFVTSAIWIAAEHVWDNYRVYRVNQQIQKTAQNIRDYYGNTIQQWGAPGFAVGQDITANIEQLLPNTDIFPAEMRRDPSQVPGSATDVIDHAINNSAVGGSFHVSVVKNPVTNIFDVFRLQIQGVSTAACINLLMSAPLTSDTIGYVRVGTNLPACGAINKGAPVIAGGCTGVIPMSQSQAQTWCTGATEVDFDFALHN